MANPRDRTPDDFSYENLKPHRRESKIEPRLYVEDEALEFSKLARDRIRLDKNTESIVPIRMKSIVPIRMKMLLFYLIIGFICGVISEHALDLTKVTIFFLQNVSEYIVHKI